MTTLRRAIEIYILAKDGNRPHLMDDAFTANARLEMNVKTARIAFPGTVEGRAEIARVLSSEFAQCYENVYTFCVSKPPAEADEFECLWLVVMTEKDTAAALLGIGRYTWRRAGRSAKISALRITLEEMAALPRQSAPALLQWVSTLPYPWCPIDRLAAQAPDFDEVTRACAWLGKELG